MPTYAWLDVHVNGQAKGTILAFWEDGLLWVPNDFMQKVGRLDSLVRVVREVEGTRYVKLQSIVELEHSVDQTRGRLDIVVNPEWLRPHKLRVGWARENTTPYSRGRGGHLGYDLVAAQYGGQNTEVQAFLQPVLFNSKGTFQSGFRFSHLNMGGSDFQRLDSYWEQELFASHSRLQLGDFVSADNGFGGRFRVAGLSWRRDFSMTPYTPTFATPIITGTARLPSAIELYVDGVRRAQVQTEPGPYAIEDAPLITGSGRLEIVQRNILGEVIVQEQDFYVDPALLRQGLSDFDVGVGWLRKNFNARNFDYGGVHFAGMYRYGVSDAANVEMRGAMNAAGQSMDLRYLLRAGALPVTLTAGLGFIKRVNSSPTPNHRVGMVWRYQRYFLNAQMLQHSELIEDTRLGLISNQRSLRAGARVGAYSLSVSHVYQRRFLDRFSRYEASASRSFHWGGQHISARVDVFRQDDDIGGDDYGVGLSLSVSPGRGHHVHLAHREDGYRQTTLSYSQRSFDDLGASSRVTLQDRDGTLAAYANVDYRDEHWAARGYLQKSENSEGLQLGINGALGYLGGHMFASRTLGSSYALVDTAPLGNVPVYLHSRLVTRTNSKGFAIVPALVPYQENSLRIDPETIPVSSALDSSTVSVTPATNTGVILHFPIRQVRGVQLRLMLRPGIPVPSGARIDVTGQGGRYFVGDNGESYVELSDSDAAFTVYWKDSSCQFSIALDRIPNEVLPHIGAVRCH